MGGIKLKKKFAVQTITILLIIFAFIVCLILNFPDSLMGHTPTIKNLVVTVVYITIWVFVLSIASRNKDRVMMKYYSVFWLITLFFAILTVLVNAAVFNAHWATPFIALLLTPWYGIELMVDNFLITSVIISSVSLILFIAILLSLKRLRSI